MKCFCFKSRKPLLSCCCTHLYLSLLLLGDFATVKAEVKEPSSYALRRGQHWEIMCVIEQDQLQGAQIERLRERCEQELQRHGPILKGETWTLRFYTSRRFNELNCVGWVRLNEEVQRKWIIRWHSM
jgi:hypothetical protein